MSSHRAYRPLASVVSCLLATDTEPHAAVAAQCLGGDGRRVRKLVLCVLSVRGAVVRNPESLTGDDLLEAVKAAG